MAISHKWRKRFQGHVSRWTAPREAILDLLSSTTRHISVKEIYTTLYKLYPDIGLTTIYRTLDLLDRMGLINKITFVGGQARYELKSNEKKQHHHHIICMRCGKIIDYNEFEAEELELIKKTEKRLAQKYNFRIKDHNIEFLGFCEQCR